MCDTFVAIGNSTADGSVIFGKNSDREPNEAHEVVIIPAMRHQPGSLVKCTYIEIPQVEHTYAVLLAKPFWIWGAEMGMNEHGVTIGNEAIFTKVPQEKDPSLIGMDFIRLALERAKTALEALHVITRLLETYGQAGSCGFTHPFYYHNSYILADPQEAWVLETAGRQWVAEKVTGVRSISNGATIGSEWDLASDDLVRYAVDRGWCKNRADFSFAQCYSDFLYTHLSDSKNRRVCTTDLLKTGHGRNSVQTAFRILRSHGKAVGKDLRLDRSLMGAHVCMHAGAGPVRESQSVGSLVAHLKPDLYTAWVTATAAPCLSIYKPVWIDSGYPLSEPSPTGKYDPACLWWRHEQFHREVIHDFANRLLMIEADREKLEFSFLDSFEKLLDSTAARRAFSEACFHSADQKPDGWRNRIQAEPVARQNHFYYTLAWNGFNQKAKMGMVQIRLT